MYSSNMASKLNRALRVPLVIVFRCSSKNVSLYRSSRGAPLEVAVAALVRLVPPGQKVAEKSIPQASICALPGMRSRFRMISHSGTEL